MSFSLSRRAGFAWVAAACAGAIAFALFAQYQLGLEPCPMCIMQRVAVMALGLLAGLAALHNPGRSGAMVWGGLTSVAALAGAGVALRQVWLQHLPADQVPSCGPGLDFMLETLPLRDVLSRVLAGDGQCAIVDWRLFGLSMAGWSAVFFVLVLAFIWGVVLRAQK